jgi:Trypsin-co-occurring domain 1
MCAGRLGAGAPANLVGQGNNADLWSESFLPRWRRPAGSWDHTRMEPSSRQLRDYLPVRLGDVSLVIETIQLPGSEPTAGWRDVTSRVSDAFEKAQEAIVELASKLATTVSNLETSGKRPDHLALEFGLSFTVEGNLLFVASSADASLKVTISYDRSTRTDERRSDE